MTIRAFFLYFYLRRRRLGLSMTETIVSPPTTFDITFGILNHYIRTIQRSGKIAAARGFRPRTASVLPRQGELQLLKKDHLFRKHVRLLKCLVRTRFHVNVVILRKKGMAPVKRVRGKGRPDEYPFTERVWQDQIAGFRVLRRMT